MPKLTKEKFLEYKALNINGFAINLHKVLYPFAHGDEYPQFQQIIFNDDTTQIIINISYFKFYDDRAEYTIKAKEFKKSDDINNKFMIGGSGYYSKLLHKEEMQKSKFNLKHLQELCNSIDIEKEKKLILNEYLQLKAVENGK